MYWCVCVLWRVKMWMMMTLSRRTRVFTAHQCAQTVPAEWKRTNEVGQQRKRRRVGDISVPLLTVLRWPVTLPLFRFFFSIDDWGPWKTQQKQLYSIIWSVMRVQMSANSCFRLVVMCPLLSLSVSQCREMRMVMAMRQIIRTTVRCVSREGRSSCVTHAPERII